AEGGAAALAGCLNVGLEAEHTGPELIIIAELGASEGAIKVRGARERADAGQGRVELRLAPAVADVGAPIQARPGVEGSGRRRRRVIRSWPRVHVRSPRRSPREHNKRWGTRPAGEWIAEELGCCA